MPSYRMCQWVTAELKAGSAVDLDQYLGDMIRRAVERQGGGVPAGEPRVRWHQITEAEALLSQGLFAGDWFADVSIDVAAGRAGL